MTLLGVQAGGSSTQLAVSDVSADLARCLNLPSFLLVIDHEANAFRNTVAG